MLPASDGGLFGRSQALDFRIKGDAEHYGGEKWNLKAEIGRYAAVPQGLEALPMLHVPQSSHAFRGKAPTIICNQKRKTNSLVHVDPVPITKSSVAGQAISYY